MKKLYLLLATAFAFALNANAGTKVLYNQTFETASSATDAGWASPSAAAGLSLGSDDYGQYLSFAPTGNDRSCHTIWGADLIKSANATAYTVSFDFSANKWGTNHQSTEITLMSDETTCTKKPNGNFRGNSVNWLFDLTQLASYNDVTASSTGTQYFAINGDSANVIGLDAGMFYTVTLDVDTVARTVDYSIVTSTGDAVTSGAYSVPEGTNMAATGIYFLGARYFPVQYFDNINVSVESDEDVANTPTVSLTGINMKQRVYTISFMEGETLHLSYNGTELDPISYDDCDGNYTWSNNENYDADYSESNLVTDDCSNGELIAWTTAGSATSEKVTTQVDNDVITVPAATATISAVEAGYNKTYTLTVDNSATPLSPTIFISYVYKDNTGTEKASDSDLTSGATATIGAGTLEVTTSAFGYGESTMTVTNNVAYEQKADYNFAHFTEADITALGFANNGAVTGSTCDHWTSYGRYYYYDADSVKNAYTDATLYTKKSSAFTDSVLYENVAFTAVPPVNVNYVPGEGIIASGRKGDDESGSWITSLYLVVNGYTDNDFVAVYQTSNYGQNALHPVAESLDDYLYNHDNAPVFAVQKATEQIGLYRISNCLARIQVFSPKNGATGIKNIAAEEAAVNDPNAPMYNLAGQRVNKDYKGVVIQNGKKRIVR